MRKTDAKRIYEIISEYIILNSGALPILCFVPGYEKPDGYGL